MSSVSWRKIGLGLWLTKQGSKNVILLEKLFENEVIDEEENLKNSKAYGQDEE